MPARAFLGWLAYLRIKADPTELQWSDSNQELANYLNTLARKAANG